MSALGGDTDLMGLQMTRPKDVFGGLAEITAAKIRLQASAAAARGRGTAEGVHVKRHEVLHCCFLELVSVQSTGPDVGFNKRIGCWLEGGLLIF
ncbi:MAG: hypothetical protein AAF667_06770 [Pseudomonadota bacterium]